MDVLLVSELSELMAVAVGYNSKELSRHFAQVESAFCCISDHYNFAN